MTPRDRQQPPAHSLAMLIKGYVLEDASRSVDILLRFDHLSDFFVNPVLFALEDGLCWSGSRADAHLSLRCLVFLTPGIDVPPRIESFLARVASSRWQVRRLETNPVINFAMVDSGDRMLWFSFDPDRPILGFAGRENDHFAEHFDDFWVQSEPMLAGAEELYNREMPPELEGQLIVDSREAWDTLLYRFANNPQELLKVDPRMFEELIAELLLREGFEPRLTPRSRDGGRDILAFHRGIVGSQLYLVECKRYSRERPVGVRLVRGLYGVVEQERATAGLLVTSSYFSREALAFAEGVKYRLNLRDYNDVSTWIRSKSGGR